MGRRLLPLLADVIAAAAFVAVLLLLAWWLGQG